MNDAMQEQLSKITAHPLRTLKTMSTEDIVNILKIANDKYRNTNTTLMNDDLYDIVMEFLEERVPDHPFLSEVGAPIKGEKVDLPYWMGSLNKIRDDEKSIVKWMHDYPGDVVVSDKLDGNSGMIVLTPTKKMLYSRGNGVQGQNLNQMIPFLHLPDVKPPAGKTWAIRGELIISRANWEKIKSVGANARNVVAGCLNKKIPDPKIAERVDFVVYELVYPKLSPSEGLAFLKEQGFNVVNHALVKESTLAAAPMKVLSDILMERRKSSPYEVDGIVVYQDKQHNLVNGKNPANAFAYKSIHTHEEVEVIVTEVEWKVSKDGYIKPTVKFLPKSLAGVTISRATGFNAAFIEKHVIGVGSRIVIIRSGDVIPHITRVITPASDNRPSMPTNIAYKWNATHVDIEIDDAVNSDMMKSLLEHFAKKLDITGVGPGIVKKMVDADINTIPKFMNVKTQDLLKIEGFQDKSATKVADAIKTAREKATFADIMIASNVFGRGMGHSKIQAVLKAIPSILDRNIPVPEDVAKVEGIGASTATMFVTNLPKIFALMDEIGLHKHTTTKALRSSPPKQAAAEAGPSSSVFSGLTVVFTGFRNKDWEKIIESQGGKVTTTVSKNTSLVVAKDPDENGGKIRKAKELGVKIVSPDAFQATYL
jgi:NAD-dependent DNA ligase